MRVLINEMRGLILAYCLTWSSLFILAYGDGYPPGHLLPLGSHMPPQGGISVTGKFPSPWVFYEEFVKQSQPLVMRKVLMDSDIPAFEKWTDAYLSDIFGHLPVEVESGKKEDRENGTVWHMTLEKYISKYQKLNGYLVTDIPEEMKVDLKVPLTLQCGGFQNNLQSIIMWFSSGGTKSHLHNDGLDNINCVLDGTKELVLIDLKHADLVHADGWEENESYSHVNVDRVDMHEFPKLQKVPWYKVVVNKGDCLFIPYRWFHQVHSLPGRNLALNFWFHHRMWYNTSECTDMDPYTAPFKPLRQFTFPQRMEEARSLLLESLEGKENITLEDFSTLFGTEQKDDGISECFGIIDEDKNDLLDWPELYKFDLNKMVKDYPVLFADLTSESEAEQSEGQDSKLDDSEPGKEDLYDDGEEDDVDDDDDDDDDDDEDEDVDVVEEKKEEEDVKQQTDSEKPKVIKFVKKTIETHSGRIPVHIHGAKQEPEEVVVKCFGIIDEDKNDLLDWPELYKFDLNKMVKDYPVLFADLTSESEAEQSEGQDSKLDDSEPGKEDLYDDGEEDDVDDDDEDDDEDEDVDVVEEKKEEEDVKQQTDSEKPKVIKFVQKTIETHSGRIPVHIHGAKQEPEEVVVKVKSNTNKMKHEEL